MTENDQNGEGFNWKGFSGKVAGWVKKLAKEAEKGIGKALSNAERIIDEVVDRTQETFDGVVKTTKEAVNDLKEIPEFKNKKMTFVLSVNDGEVNLSRSETSIVPEIVDLCSRRQGFIQTMKEVGTTLNALVDDKGIPMLSAKTVTVLRNNGITSIYDLLNCQPASLMEIKFFGAGMLREVGNALSKNGMYFGMNQNVLTAFLSDIDQEADEEDVDNEDDEDDVDDEDNDD